MIKLETNGLKFNQQLKAAFEEAWYDNDTVPTSTMFDDFTNKDNLRAWEIFNGESMVGLRWALSISGPYTVATNTIDTDMMGEFTCKTMYKAYPINESLSIKLLINKINDTKVVIFGLDTNTGDMAYGFIDLEAKELKTGTGPGHLKEVLGSYHGPKMLEYLQPNN